MYDSILQRVNGENPRKKAGWLSQLIFAWIIPILHKGSKNGLTETDLPKCLPDDNSAKLGDRLEENWQKTNNLKLALLKTFWTSAVVDGFVCLFYIMLKSTIPLALAQLLIEYQNLGMLNDYGLAASNGFHNSTENVTVSEAVEYSEQQQQQQPAVITYESVLYFMWHDVRFLGFLVVGATLLGCFINHHVDQRQKRMGAKMRIACGSLIIRMITKLATSASSDTSNMLNLYTNDLKRLDIGFVYAHYLWILPIQTVLVGYLLWCQIGYAAVVGVAALLLLTLPVQLGLSSLTAELRDRIAILTDIRANLMKELIQAIQVIKMYVWELAFQQKVKEARADEIRATRSAAYLRSVYLSTMILPERLTLFFTIMAAQYMGIVMSPAIIFSMGNFYHVLQLVAGIFCPMAISFASETEVSFQRIEKFLNKEERKKPAIDMEPEANALEIHNVNASWGASDSKNSAVNGCSKEPMELKPLVKPITNWTLKNINMNIPKGKLCIIIGPVGSGKSSLLHLILRELPAAQGELKTLQDISYSSQESFLFPDTIRSNILFNEEENSQRLEDVYRNCALEQDIQSFPERDLTHVGDQGSALSGGQRARVNLARSIYKAAQLYLFDDPLSAVDARVGRHIFDNVMGPQGMLSNKTRILVTHQVQYLNQADLIVHLKNGEIQEMGIWQDMKSKIDEEFGTLNQNQIDATAENAAAGNAEQKVAADSEMTIGTEKTENTMNEEKKADNAKNQIDATAENAAAGNAEQKVAAESEMPVGTEKTEKTMDEENNADNAEEQTEGYVPCAVWLSYFKAGSTPFGLMFLSFILFASQFVCSYADYFVNIYTKIQCGTTCVVTYTVLIAAVVIMIIWRCYLFLKMCMRSSKVLHDRMFGQILRATMRFFDTNPSGRIQNRFISDMGAIDEQLPRVMSEFTHLALVMLGVLVVICIVNPVILGGICMVAVADYFIIGLYLRSSQDLKRLEARCRSPVYSHILACVAGLPIIRARNMESKMVEIFDKLQDMHSAAFHLTLSSNTALGLWLDCVNVCFLLNTVTFCFILIGDPVYSGNMGLAISQAMMLTGMVQYGLRQLGETFQQMTSVERILEYTQLETETDSNGNENHNVTVAPTSWPTKGKIEFSHVNGRYEKNGEIILKHLDMIIEPGWRIGIVGRTGAGKTTLISTLFRLCFVDGELIIDGWQTQNLPLDQLRSNISIIPQEPVLFKGTLRYNLDPFKNYKDDELYAALNAVELRNVFQSLDHDITENGKNVSVGQRQLICMARALLRKNKILILDEATANVDQGTDALIQTTIREKFGNCTVLTVAHRLKTIMDYDRILVLDMGEKIDFDEPKNLLSKEGLFKEMVEATGNEAESLKKLAGFKEQSKKK